MNLAVCIHFSFYKLEINNCTHITGLLWAYEAIFVKCLGDWFHRRRHTLSFYYQLASASVSKVFTLLNHQNSHMLQVMFFQLFLFVDLFFFSVNLLQALIAFDANAYFLLVKILSIQIFSLPSSFYFLFKIISGLGVPGLKTFKTPLQYFPFHASLPPLPSNSSAMFH